MPSIETAQWKLGAAEEVHQQMRNPFILTGYRINFTLRKTITSLFMLHNETINIWTHLIFLILILTQAASEAFNLGLFSPFKWLYNEQFSQGNEIERWPIVVFLLCAAMCLFSSTVYHLFSNYSLWIERHCLRLDYAGINFLIAGTSVPFIYYRHYCDPILARFYCSLEIAMGTILFGVSLSDFFHSEKMRYVRVISYALYGTAAGVPIILFIMSGQSQDPFSGSAFIPIYFSMGAAYLLGLLIYAIRCPERFYPGRFDIVGQSHQVWHMAVNMGIFLSYISTELSYHERQLFPECRITT